MGNRDNARPGSRKGGPPDERQGFQPRAGDHRTRPAGSGACRAGPARGPAACLKEHLLREFASPTPPAGNRPASRRAGRMPQGAPAAGVRIAHATRGQPAGQPKGRPPARPPHEARPPGHRCGGKRRRRQPHGHRGRAVSAARAHWPHGEPKSRHRDRRGRSARQGRSRGRWTARRHRCATTSMSTSRARSPARGRRRFWAADGDSGQQRPAEPRKDRHGEAARAADLAVGVRPVRPGLLRDASVAHGDIPLNDQGQCPDGAA